MIQRGPILHIPDLRTVPRARVNTVTSPVPAQAGPRPAGQEQGGGRPIRRDGEAGEGAPLPQGLCGTGRMEERGVLAAAGHATRSPLSWCGFHALSASL